MGSGTLRRTMRALCNDKLMRPYDREVNMSRETMIPTEYTLSSITLDV
jgi:hypothetical protein